jgi:putative ABC transport system permease protein
MVSWLNPGETGAVVLASGVRDRSVPDLGPGDEVRLFIEGKPTTWRIAGIVDEADSSGGGVYATADGLASATGTATGEPQQVNRLRLITDRHDERTRQDVAAAADAALTGAGIDVEQSASVSRQEAAGSGHLGPVLLVLIGVALPLGVLGAIGLAATMSANVLDRIREFGVLHAIGARPKTVRRIVITEGVILAITSCLVAALPTLGLTALLGYGLGTTFGNLALPFTISTLGVGLWLLVVVLGAALATDAAATRASRITVREALAYL